MPSKTTRKTTAQSLIIVESPAKAKTIKKMLGRGYQVKASVGHIRDIDSKGRGKDAFGIDFDNGFEPHYIVLPGKKKTVAELKSATDKAAEVYLAPDPDREGEAIAWHLKEALKLSGSKVKRITCPSITKKAVTEAIQNPRDIDMNLVGAQKGRRVLDRIVGFSLSPFLWKKVAKKLSAGRVQSVAVRLIVEKEQEIAAFQTKEFWKITAQLHAQNEDPSPFNAVLVSWKDEKFALNGKHSSSEEKAREVETALKVADFRIVDMISKNTSSKPPLPFITSTLQQAASSQLRFGTRRTMQIAQQLYEGIELADGPVGLITYMRTDSPRLDPEAVSDIRNWIGEKFPDKLPEQPRLYGGKAKKGVKIQDAHEGIRPTSVQYTPDSIKPYLTQEQYRLYNMIWIRAVASQMKDTRYAVTTIKVAADHGILEASGRITLFEGFTVLAPEAKKSREEYQNLPTVDIQTPLTLDKLTTEQKWTKPPPRFTEASLVKTLEKEGIGRPSTYASIIQTIRDRGYVRLEKRIFYANELGITVNSILLTEFPDILDYHFTADMENSLDAVEEGTVDWHKLLADFYRNFAPRVEAAVENAEPLKGRKWNGSESCPICGKFLVYRYSITGAFLGCSDFPECKGLIPLPGEGSDDGETDGEPVVCPKCGKTMLLKSSRYGKFYACSGYPDCSNIANLGADGQAVFLPDISMDCDECGTPMEVKSKRRGPVMVCPDEDCRRELPVKDGVVIDLPKAGGIKCEKCSRPMIVRLSRRGPFLACTGFPQCHNALSLQTTEENNSGKNK